MLAARFVLHQYASAHIHCYRHDRSSATRTPVDVVRQIDLICVPQLMSAERSLAAPDGSGVRQPTECSLRRVMPLAAHLICLRTASALADAAVGVVVRLAVLLVCRAGLVGVSLAARRAGW
jgi:hypothetical protein